MEDAFGNWLAGFIDGEGSFNIRHQDGGYLCLFQLSVRADDVEILQQVRVATNIGRIYRSARNQQNPMVRWQVHRQNEAQLLVALLDRYPLRAKKARDFAVWREAVRALRFKDYGRLQHLRDELHRVRRYENSDVEFDVSPVVDQLSLLGVDNSL